MDKNILLFFLFPLIALIYVHISYQTNFQHIKNQQISIKYQRWKKQFSMSFSKFQDHYRFNIFIQNLNKINQHNNNIERTYDLGINQFFHLTEYQFYGYYLVNTRDENYDKQGKNIRLKLKNIGNLSDIDWQIIGKVSQIKNQGNCDAGYAFSTTSLIETSLMMQNQNILLSEQQIIDCAIQYQTLGCNGGSRAGAIKYAQQKGLSSQTQYPYNGVKNQCKLPSGKYKADFTMFQAIGCEQIKDNLYTSPLTVAVNARNWQLYSNGIFSNCPSTGELNHQTLLVGATTTYWRVKNSWGTRWGESGYIRIKFGNNCGICQRPAYGFIL